MNSFDGVCGICGSSRDGDGRRAAAMAARLRHRGPDDSGIHVDPHAGISLGATRLSIIDVEGGHQPLTNEDGSVIAVLNGEIYNHAALAEQLLRAGHRFKTHCDTEILVHLYEEFGPAFAHALEGMYAVAIWDSRKRDLVLARDRFGEKPLFYRHAAGDLEFSSELTSLLSGTDAPRELDPAVLDAYFVLGYVPGPGTLVRGVVQLPPGHTLVWSAERRSISLDCYWRPFPAEVEGDRGQDELGPETERLLERAVRSRLVADVPVGVFLSGGLDSTLVATLAAQASSEPIKTFTVGYDVGGVNETVPARAAAEAIGADHHELTLRESDLPELAESVFSRLDQPIADQALLASHAVSRFAREEVKVVVGGEGADELFAGYPRYRWLERAQRLGSVLPSAGAAGLASAVRRLGLGGRARHLAHLVDPKPLLERHLLWVTDGRSQIRGRLYGPAMRAPLRSEDLQAIIPGVDRAQWGHPNVVRELMRLDQRLWLPDDVLAKADRASMLASLEVRTPFLERSLAELAASVPARRHLENGGKSLLREVLDRRLPEARSKRRKTAFRVPAADWLRGPLAPMMREQIATGHLYSQGFVSKPEAARLMDAHALGDHDHSQVLWPLLALGAWMDSFLSG